MRGFVRPPMKPITSTLLEVTGPRPRCYYCDKTLRPNTFGVRLDGHIDHIPSVDEMAQMPRNVIGMAIGFGYRPERVFRVTYKTLYDGEPATELRCWCGTYNGRGKGKDCEWPLFCDLGCSLSFAAACWNAGMRMKRD